MARDHARVELSIWDDPDFVVLSGEAQRLYLFLLSQRDLSYAGLVPMRLRRWAGRSATATVDAVTAALAELDAARFVVCDHDTEEVLVRSLIRRDGIYKQPNVLAAALREAFEISSPVLRRALVDELLRLPAEVTGPAPELAASALLAGAGDLPPAVKAALTGRRPARGRPVEPAVPAPDRGENSSGNPSVNPSGKALGEGRGERGERPPASVDQQVGVRAPARAYTREEIPPAVRPEAPGSMRQRRQAEARRLVRTHSPAQPARVLTKLTTEVVGLLGDGVDPAHVAAGLRVWASKRLSVSMLPELVGEYMRAELVGATHDRVRSDADTVATFERLRATCDNGSPVADVVLGDLGEHVPAARLAELMTDAAHRALAVVA
ncbi:hypothetical protein [Actinophytocola sp.]|uniref:hypothetical protein n=1 Tax=Actinophytocola sp. TaxID=1872138 RepID=UPI003D6C5B9B